MKEILDGEATRMDVMREKGRNKIKSKAWIRQRNEMKRNEKIERKKRRNTKYPMREKYKNNNNKNSKARVTSSTPFLYASRDPDDQRRP